MPHPSDRLKLSIETGALEITRMRDRIKETFEHRDTNVKKREEWHRACQVFHARYDELSFPGGFKGALERLLAGDPETMEAAICFLEVRPYFFGSGYMFQSIYRKTKRAPLTSEQEARLAHVTQALDAWKARKAAARIATGQRAGS